MLLFAETICKMNEKVHSPWLMQLYMYSFCLTDGPALNSILKRAGGKLRSNATAGGEEIHPNRGVHTLLFSLLPTSPTSKESSLCGRGQMPAAEGLKLSWGAIF